LGRLLEIVPLFFQKSTTTPVEGTKPTMLFVWLVVTSTFAKVASLPLADDSSVPC
jgi:cbb3-type cytochrome oxidase cytochrome c subunit